MKTININGKEFTIEQLNSLIEQSTNNPMIEVYKYHNTTEGEFDKKFEGLSDWLKAQEQEAMIVNFYNKGVKPDWDNKNQYKYYPWFYLGNDFRFYDSNCYDTASNCSARLCFLRESDLMEAVEKFIKVYERSRNS